MSAVFKREFKNYFTGPMGYVFLALFAFFQGLMFASIYSAGYPYIEYLFDSMFSIVLFVTPILTMRLFSEDKRLKTDQLLFTAPVGLSAVVMGKFLAALAVFMLGFSFTLVFQIILAASATVDWMMFVSNLIGMLLIGGALISMGIFFSALTESQVVAAILSFAAALFLLFLDSLSEMVNVPFVTTVANAISFSGRYSAFVSGTLDYANIVFFLSFAGIFLFVTTRVLERKRWA